MFLDQTQAQVRVWFTRVLSEGRKGLDLRFEVSNGVRCRTRLVVAMTRARDLAGPQRGVPLCVLSSSLAATLPLEGLTCRSVDVCSESRLD